MRKLVAVAVACSTFGGVLYHHSGKSGWGVRPAPDRPPHSRFSPLGHPWPVVFYNA